MLYQRSSCRLAPAKRDTRFSGTKGSVTPFLVMSVFLLLVTMGISTDLMRDFETTNQLEFAAQTAALYALSLTTNSDGSYSFNNAQTNIQNAILNASGFAWNLAQFGPQNNVWSKAVTFSTNDIQFANNPLDQNEFFVQLTGSRRGADALQQFFLPLAYVNFSSASLPLTKVSPAKVVEVFGQPASRIGAGVPAASQSNTRAQDFIGFATLPFAISNQQFANIASPSQISTTYIIDLVSSSSTGAAQPGHIKGCFVNVSGTGSSSGNYYGNAQGPQAINQLISLLAYFTSGNGSVLPTNVERGSLLGAFDPATFTATQQTSISQAVSQLPNRFYIIPVLANDPNFAGNNNTVIGFARFKLDSVNTVGSTITSLTMDIGESIPVRNASSATGFYTVSNSSNTPMPAPVYPFLPRQYDTASNGITIRQRGVILAPALSPRQITPS